MTYMLDTNICIYVMKNKPNLPFGSAAASAYGAIMAYLQKQGTPIGPLDMLIAGHARSEDLVLVTNNVREFVRVPGLAIENRAEQ